MARVTRTTIEALMHTASTLENACDYQWGHMGSCNCGFLAREIASLDKASIHRAAMQRYGNWTEQLNDYCPTSGLLMDDLITTMLDAGFDIDDLQQLETLSNANVLRTLPPHQRYLQYNLKRDVVTYLRAWCAYLQRKSELDKSHRLPDSIVPEPADTCSVDNEDDNLHSIMTVESMSAAY